MRVPSAMKGGRSGSISIVRLIDWAPSVAISPARAFSTSAATSCGSGRSSAMPASTVCEIEDVVDEHAERDASRRGYSRCRLRCLSLSAPAVPDASRSAKPMMLVSGERSS